MLKHQRLIRQLEAIPHGQFLLHGSPTPLSREPLVPRRPPMRFQNRKELGRKRIYATSVIMIGLLYAVIRSPSSAWTWAFQRDEEGKLRFYIRLQSGQQLFMKRAGYLYVVPRAPFRSIQNVLIYSTHTPVRPVKTIRVSADAVIWYLNEEGSQFVREFPEPPEPPRRTYRHVKVPR